METNISSTRQFGLFPLSVITKIDRWSFSSSPSNGTRKKMHWIMNVRLSWSKSITQQFVSFQILLLNLWAEYICTDQVHWIRRKFKRSRLKVTYCTSGVFRKDLEVLSLEEITSPKCAKNNSTSLSVMSGGLYLKESVRNCVKKEVENKFYI